VPRSTEGRIEELCARIRDLCGEPFSEDSEEELRRLARHLRTAIQQHVRMAKSSLGTQKSAIVDRDSNQIKADPNKPGSDGDGT
jgi:hypothetical protein